MTRKEYVERVLSQVRHADRDERAAIQTEIDAHIEDHICALLELGYDAQLAEERTMALMGDPEEVGVELDKQYAPQFWSRLEGFAALVMVVVLLQAVLGLGILFHARDSLLARIAPERLHYSHAAGEIYREEDIRIPVGNDILRVYRVSMGQREEYHHATDSVDVLRTAKVSMCAYDRIPCGIVSDEIHRGLALKNQRGEILDDIWASGGGGTGSYGAEYMSRSVDIAPGDAYVTLCYDRFGESFSVDIPLPEEMP